MKKWVILIVFSLLSFVYVYSQNLNERIDENKFIRLDSENNTIKWVLIDGYEELKYGNNWKLLAAFTDEYGIINRFMYQKSYESEIEVLNTFTNLINYFQELNFSDITIGNINNILTVLSINQNCNYYIYLTPILSCCHNYLILQISSERLMDFTEK